jgi:membrane protein implicated in regulation of membrane protease activity
VTESCSTCLAKAPSESRWKGVALLVGAIVFCPCHLPATIAVLAAFGGSAWLVGSPALLYLAFGVTYLFVIGYALAYLARKRDAERRLEALHAEHTRGATTSAVSSSGGA